MQQLDDSTGQRGQLTFSFFGCKGNFMHAWFDGYFTGLVI